MPGRGMNPVREKWMKMTPEQRKEFINKRKKMGFGPWGRDDFFNRGDFGMDKDFEMDENVDSSKKDAYAKRARRRCGAADRRTSAATESLYPPEGFQ